MKWLIGIIIFLLTLYGFCMSYTILSGATIEDVVDMYPSKISISSKCIDGEKIILIQRDKYFQGIHAGTCEVNK